MKRTGSLVRWAVALVAALAIGVGALTVFTQEAVAGPCICPQIYAPVICDNGKTYPNQCVANCRHAKNCVPTGGGVE